MIRPLCVVCADRPANGTAYKGLCTVCSDQLDRLPSAEHPVYYALPDVLWAARRARAAERARARKRIVELEIKWAVAEGRTRGGGR